MHYRFLGALDPPHMQCICMWIRAPPTTRTAGLGSERGRHKVNWGVYVIRVRPSMHFFPSEKRVLRKRERTRRLTKNVGKARHVQAHANVEVEDLSYLSDLSERELGNWGTNSLQAFRTQVRCRPFKSSGGSRLRGIVEGSKVRRH